MTHDTPPPDSLHDQALALRGRAAALRRLLAQENLRPRREVVEQLAALEKELTLLGEGVKELETGRSSLAALAHTAQLVNSSLELDEVLRIVMDTLVRLTHAERGFLMLREEDGDMTLRLARNWDLESIPASEQTISSTVVASVIDSGEPLLTTNAQDDSRLMSQESIVAFNLRSILCVPLKVKNELIGVIYADNRVRSGIFAETERDLLSAFADQAAVAIENARLFLSLRSSLTEVTGLKRLMDDIFASIASGVITADIRNRITLCNRAAEAMLELSAEALIGRPLEEALPPLAAEIQDGLKEVHATDQPRVGLEISPVLPGRGPVSWRLNLSPLKDAGQRTQGIAIVLDDLTERRRLEAQRRLLERMVSPAVLDQIDPNQLEMGGDLANITILFADIRGFSTYSEGQTPGEVVAVLNRYLSAAAEAILNEEGTVDKFLGDAVMAWFNAPLPQPDHTLRAVRAALALRSSVERLHRELPEAEHLSFGMGIHYGEALLGWIGNEKRLEYTAISDGVNSAWRIQENAGRGQILISREAWERVQDRVEAVPVTPLVVKGRVKPIEVFDLRGLKTGR